MKISTLILTQDNGDTIEETLASVREVSDEIVVIDSDSKDATLAICERYGCRVFRRMMGRDGYAGLWNFGNAKCRNGWILRIDSDEVLTPGLAKEIRALEEKAPFAAYRLRRKEYFLKRQFLATNIVRLFRKGKGRWVGKTHEHLEVEGPIGQLKRPFEHRNQRQTLDSWAHKLTRVTKEEVEFDTTGRYDLGRATILFRMLYEPLKWFFGLLLYKRLLFKGMPGLIYSVNAAFYAFFLYARAYERKYVK